jgi:hypothetical protein
MINGGQRPGGILVRGMEEGVLIPSFPPPIPFIDIQRINDVK